MRIILTGGGSGGHAMPLLAVVKALSNKLARPPRYLWIGSSLSLERELAQKNNIDFRAILVGKWRRYFSLANFFDLFKIPLGIIQAVWIVKKFRADVIFSKGGFVSVPAVVAGKLLGIPVVTHESDLLPGLANKIIAHLASVIAITFTETAKFFPGRNVHLTGNPLRQEVITGQGWRAEQKYGLRQSPPVILLLGGSQGARLLNNTLVAALPELLTRYQIMHVCGPKMLGEVEHQVAKLAINSANYHLVKFLSGEELGDMYQLASLVITRAGANTLSEIAAVGRPAIIIPIKSAVLGEHQKINARYFSERGAALVISEERLDSPMLVKTIDRLVTNHRWRKKMSEQARKIASQDAAEQLAEIIIKLAQPEN